MKVILHMGNYKTASSSIQGWMYRNRAELSACGVYYGCCDEPPVCAQSSFTYGLLREVLKGMGNYGEYERHPLFSYIQETPDLLWRRMLGEARERGCSRIVISHEGMFCEAFRTLGGLRRVPGMELWQEVNREFHRRLWQLVSADTEACQAVVYLRGQDTYLESQYNQYCKMPWYEEEIRLPDFAEFYSLCPVMLDYREPMGVLQEIYGEGNVTVRSYPGENEPYEGFARNVLGLDRATIKAMAPPDRSMENRSFCYDAVEFKRLVLGPELAQNPEVCRILAEYSEFHPDREKYTYLTPELRREIEERYMQYNGELPGVCLPLSPEEGKILYPGLSPEGMMELTEYVTDSLKKS